MGILRTSIWAIVIAAISFGISCLLRTPPLPYTYHGKVEPGFEAVERAFKENFDQGFESDGASFAICYNGKMVVDLWGGYADQNALRPWKEDTITLAMSVTKGVSAICLALLVDRGQLKYEDLVTKYWPEFGAHGKSNVTVKMLIGHEAGLVVIDEPITKDAVKNWRLMSKLFENQIPNWPPGTTAGYHTITFGWLADQLLRRVDPKQRSIGQFFKEEIADPHGIDFFIGLPKDQMHRMARLTYYTLPDVIKRLDDLGFLKLLYRHFVRGASELGKKVLKNPSWLRLGDNRWFPFNDPDIQMMEIPGANGIGTARALARLYCLLGDQSKPLLSKTLLDKISKPALITPCDAVHCLNISWGYGFMHRTNPDGQYQMGHPGYGGQNAKYDPQYNLAFAYLRNNMAPEAMGELVRTYRNLERATYESVKAMKIKKS